MYFHGLSHTQARKAWNLGRNFRNHREITVSDHEITIVVPAASGTVSAHPIAAVTLSRTT